MEEKLTRLPAGIGARFERLGPQVKESVKALWQPGLWWEELDWAYVGVIDGHDVRAVRKALRAAFEAERPVVIHVATVKGKGFAPAEEGGLEGMEKWHAAKPNSIAGRRPAAPSKKKKAAAPPQYTQVFGEAMVRECERDERVVGITAAMNSGTGLSILQKAMPERYFDVGIAEQQAILFAAGLALQGMRPVAAIYSTFLQRAFDQIVHDVCLQNLNVTFCMDRAGLVGDDGPTHHGAFDIAYLRPLPNITLMAPRDEAMLVHMLHTALRIDGPAAIRYPRGEAEGVEIPAEPTLLEVGTGEILREGERVAIVGYGSGVGKALGAADLLAEHGLDVTVADARFAKPLDAGLLAQLAAEHDLVVTVEEGVLMGGFGSAVWESLSDGGAAPRMLRVGLPDRYVTHGAPKLLHEEVGFTPERIAERIEAAVLEPRAARWRRRPGYRLTQRVVRLSASSAAAAHASRVAAIGWPAAVKITAAASRPAASAASAAMWVETGMPSERPRPATSAPAPTPATSATGPRPSTSGAPISSRPPSSSSTPCSVSVRRRSMAH